MKASSMFSTYLMSRLWALLLLLFTGSALGSLQEATQTLRDALAMAATELRNDHYASEPGVGPGVLDALSGSSPDSLLHRLHDFRDALDGRLRALAGHSGADIAGTDSSGSPFSDIDAMIALSVETNRLLLGLSKRTGELLARIAFDNRYDSLDSPVYRLHKARLLLDLAAVSDLLARVDGHLTNLDSRLGAVSSPPRLALELRSLVLEDNGTLRIGVHASNRGASPLAGISLALDLDSPVDVAIPAPEEKPLAVLAADDGAPAGPDETDVTWLVALDENLLAQPLGLRVEAREQGVPPAGFRSDTLIATFAPRTVQEDNDNDGLPDAWERSHRLNPHIDDAGRDEDGDGLDNLREFSAGTDPRNADSDGDGLSDGEELQGARGHRTDPLLIDTDGDGADDLSDASPRDAGEVVDTIEGEDPRVAVDTDEVILDGDTPSVKVRVSNAGGGTLQWSALIEDDLVADIAPGVGVLVQGEGDLEIRWPDPAHDFGETAGVVTTVRVFDVTGETTDFRTIRVCHRVCNDRLLQQPPERFTLVYPDNGAMGLSTQLRLLWKQSRDPNGDSIRYQVLVCTDPDFSDCPPRQVDAANGLAWVSPRMIAGLAGGLALFGFVASTARNRRPGRLPGLMLLIAAALMLHACSGNGSGFLPGDGPLPGPDEMGLGISGLSGGTTYYWKVVADDGNGNSTESGSRQFTTR